MQIEWRERLASGCTETVPRSTADHTVVVEGGFFEKMSRSEPLWKPEEEIRSGIRRTATDRDHEAAITKGCSGRLSARGK